MNRKKNRATRDHRLTPIWKDKGLFAVEGVARDRRLVRG